MTFGVRIHQMFFRSDNIFPSPIKYILFQVKWEPIFQNMERFW